MDVASGQGASTAPPPGAGSRASAHRQLCAPVDAGRRHARRGRAALASSEEESVDENTAPRKKNVRWSTTAKQNTQTPGPPTAEVSVKHRSCLKRRKHKHAGEQSDARHSGSNESDVDGTAVAPARTRRMTARLSGSARPKKNHGLMATVSPADARKSKAGQHPMKRAAPARGCPELDTMMQ